MSDSKEIYAKEFYGNDRKDHEQNLAKLCIKCLDRSKVLTLLNDELKKLVEKWLYPDFFQDEEYLPKSCCTKCRLVLLSKGKQSLICTFLARKFKYKPCRRRSRG